MNNKKINLKNVSVVLVIFAVMLFSTSVFSLENNNNKNLEIDFFYTPTCPACGQMKPLLEEIVDKYDFTIINYYNVSEKKNSNLFIEKLNDYNVSKDQQGYIPTTFILDSYFVGGSSTNLINIENIIINFENNVNNIDTNLIEEIESDDLEETTYSTKVLGIWDSKFSLENKSLFATTILLGFFDSLNVCSITVLIFLIVYLLSIGSLKRGFKIGLIYTIVIFLFYFLFMIALTSILSSLILKYGFYIRIIVFILSAFIGLVLIKDFFFYGKGINLGVPKSVKPILEKQLKKATLISAIIFALLASIVELPCTAVFPLIYSTILAEASIVGLNKILWIALYNLIYVLPLLVIVFGIYFSWISIEDVDRKMQKNKKLLKLIAGIILILIAIYFGYPILF
jgi:thiol-disulfide isomerase/thioredoxin